MPAPTPNLALQKPEVNNEDWDGAYYDAMDKLDAHPGSLVVDGADNRPTTPFEGQVISRTDAPGLLEQYQNGEWHEITAATQLPFIFDQPTPVGSILIAHEKGYNPQVEVVDPAGNRISIFGCTFPTLDTALLTFLSPTSFTATFS